MASEGGDAAASGNEWRQWWDIDATALYCHQRGFQRVGLQFPDSLLPDAPMVVERLQEAVDSLSSASERFGDGNGSRRCQLYLMADTSYNPACVDEVAAAHINAEAVVHYGPACMCPTSRLPTRYVFGRKAVNVPAAARMLAGHIAVLRSTGQSPPAVTIFLAHDCMHYREELEDAVANHLPEGPRVGEDGAVRVVFAQLVGCEVEPDREGSGEDSSDTFPLGEGSCRGDALSSGSAHEMAGFRWRLPQGTTMEECGAVWVGQEEDGAAFHLQMSFSASQWASVTLHKNGPEAIWAEGLPPSISKLLGRRYFLMEKAREASIVGLLPNPPPTIQRAALSQSFVPLSL